MPNLLVISEYPDEHFVSVSSTFTYHWVNAISRFYDRVDVISPIAWAPRVLAPLKSRWHKLAERLAKKDYSYSNIHVHFGRYFTRGGPMEPCRGRAKYLSICRRIIARKRLRFDLIHAHMEMHSAAALVLARRQDVPIVSTCHSNHDGLMEKIRTANPMNRETWAQVDALVRVSALDIDEIAEFCGRREHITCLVNGFDSHAIPEQDRKQLRKKFDLPADRFLFVSVARWLPRKDPIILLEAMARLVERTPQNPPMLVMVGENRMPRPIAEALDKHDLHDHVRLVGVVSPDDVLGYMKAGDATVLFSHSEGNPTVMFESLGCGRPYIGSDVGGVRTVLTDPKVGRYGPAKDLDVAVRLMGQAMSEHWDADYIRGFAQQYSWDSIAEKTFRQIHQPLLEARTDIPHVRTAKSPSKKGKLFL